MTDFLVSVAATLIAAPFVRRLMLGRGIVDVPNHRSSHATPVPRGGGLACLVGTAVAIVVAHAQGRGVPWLLFLAGAFLSVVGFADDRGDVSAIPRLAAQIAAGALMGWAVGGGWWIGLGGIVVPAVVNVVNFMDGINGITSFSMICWAVTAFVVGHRQAIPMLSLVGALAAGSALGFLPWNIPKARLFLGDAGSYLFGALAAAGLLIGWSSGAPVVVLAAPFSLYFIDTSTVLAKRALRGDSLFQAHREHVYQRLTTESGLSHTLVSLAVASLSALITLSWMAPVIWVPLTTTFMVCSLYLLTPRLTARLFLAADRP